MGERNTADLAEIEGAPTSRAEPVVEQVSVQMNWLGFHLTAEANSSGYSPAARAMAVALITVPVTAFCAVATGAVITSGGPSWLALMIVWVCAALITGAGYRLLTSPNPAESGVQPQTIDDIESRQPPGKQAATPRT